MVKWPTKGPDSHTQVRLSFNVNTIMHESELGVGIAVFGGECWEVTGLLKTNPLTLNLVGL